MDGAKPPYVVTALRQTSGRGRMDRTFVSPDGGIYVSFLFDYNPEVQLTAMAAVAVRRAIKKVCGISCSIKWVNDLYFNKKKACGILAEAVQNKVILGIGINWATSETDLPEIACGLGQTMDTAEELIDELANQLYGPMDGWLEEYRQADMLSGKKINIYQAGKLTGCGIAKGITDLGHLVTVDENGNEVVLSTGEVTVRIQE